MRPLILYTSRAPTEKRKYQTEFIQILVRSLTPANMRLKKCRDKKMNPVNPSRPQHLPPSPPTLAPLDRHTHYHHLHKGCGIGAGKGIGMEKYKNDLALKIAKDKPTPLTKFIFIFL
jgi:hypothetical protein